MRLKRMGRMASQARIQREYDDGDEQQGADSKPEPPKARPVLRRRLSVRNRLEVCICYHAEGLPTKAIITSLCNKQSLSFSSRVMMASILIFQFSFRLFLALLFTIHNITRLYFPLPFPTSLPSPSWSLFPFQSLDMSCLCQSVYFHSIHMPSLRKSTPRLLLFKTFLMCNCIALHMQMIHM